MWAGIGSCRPRALTKAAESAGTVEYRLWVAYMSTSWSLCCSNKYALQQSAMAYNAVRARATGRRLVLCPASRKRRSGRGWSHGYVRHGAPTHPLLAIESPVITGCGLKLLVLVAAVQKVIGAKTCDRRRVGAVPGARQHGQLPTDNHDLLFSQYIPTLSSDLRNRQQPCHGDTILEYVITTTADARYCS